MRKLVVVTLMISCFAFTAIHAADNAKGKESKTAKISISGTIIDDATGESLAGVSVTLEGTGKTVYTDFDGKFRFTELTPGEYTIKTTFISYQASSKKVKAEADRTERLDVKLKSLAL
jgi:hypothetical protein